MEEHDRRDESIGELVRDLAAETNTLMRQEIELAKAELGEKVRTAGRGAGLFGGAGVAALLALGALTACVIALLATALDHVWLAALIVALLWAAAAAVLAMRGREQVKEAAPAVPEQTVETLKEDVAWAKNRTRSAAK